MYERHAQKANQIARIILQPYTIITEKCHEITVKHMTNSWAKELCPSMVMLPLSVH
jgi:hypothetical protein